MNRKYLFSAIFVGLLLAIVGCRSHTTISDIPTSTVGTAIVQHHGVNRAGAEYGDDWDGWTGQTYYQWPTAAVRKAELDFFAARGMNSVRLPISWERAQHTLNGPLDASYQSSMVEYVNAATSMGFVVVLDLHNYGRYATDAFDAAGKQTSTYKKRVLGDGYLTFEHVSDVWIRLANLFKSNPRVIFNLMNEQHDAHASLDSTAIFAGYQKVLNSVRSTGSKNLILFPNTRSSDTHHWSTWSPQGGPLDSAIAAKVVDSANNMAYDMHSYQGIDSWNTDIVTVTNWARTNGKKLYLSEVGTTTNATAVSNLMAYLGSNSDVWIGWNVWNLDPYSVSTTNTTSMTATTKMSWYAPYLTVGPVQPQVCTYTYQPWSTCTSVGVQSRTVLTKTPEGCIGEPTLTQTCTYVPAPASDVDGDGVLDSDDACPKVKGVKMSTPTSNGCLPLVVTATKTYEWGTGYCKQFVFNNPNPVSVSWKSMIIYLKDGKLRGSNSVWGAVFPNPTQLGTVVVTPTQPEVPIGPGKTISTVGFCADYGISKYVGTNGGISY